MKELELINAVKICSFLDISYPTFMRQIAKTPPEDRPRRYRNNKRDVYWDKEEIIEWYEKQMLDEVD